MPIYEKIVKLLPKKWGITSADFKIANWRTNGFSFGHFNVPLFAVLKKGLAAHQDLVRVASATKWPSEIERVEVQAGFLNFYLTPAAITNFAFDKQKKSKRGKHEKLMIEYVGPNTNKPLHLGHLRNAFLGEALARLAVNAGNRVVRTNLYNDRGASLAKAMIAESRWGNEVNKNQKGDHWVGDLYVLFDKKMKNNPSLEAEIQDVVARWEQGNQKTIAHWKKLRDAAVDGQKKTLRRINIAFNKEYFESQLWDQGAKVILAGLKKGIFEKDENGNVVANLENQKLGKKVLLRANGTAVYITTDVYLAILRQKDEHPNCLLYVVGAEQDLHFKQLFAVLHLLGFDKKTRFEHQSYGIVSLPEGRMKSREGTVVDADDILDELERLASQEITTRHKELPPKEIALRGEKIALAAIKYYFLHIAPAHEVQFNPEESIAFTGNTGPYLLYTYARAQSILRKKKPNGKAKEVLKSEEEQKLLFLLTFATPVKESAFDTRDPSALAQYLYEVAAAFNEFYHSNKVIGTGGELEQARLQLVLKTAACLKTGLGLLGIETIEEM